MGGSSSSTKHETTSNQINPYQMMQYQQNYSDAQNRFAGLQPYSGPLTAGFNDTQNQAQNALLGLGNDTSYGKLYDNAIGVNQGILGQNINPNITAGQLSNTDLTPYYNPFQRDVIDASIAQNQFARDQQGVKDNAAATAAHAFGGTRQAVQNALTTEAYDRNNQQNLAALNSANFGQARQAAQFDIGNRLTADQNSFNNTLAANQFRLGAANNLTALGDARLANATRQAGLLSAVGDARQQQQQQEYTNNYNAYLQEFNRQLAQQQALNQALGIIPIEQTNTTDGTTTTKSNPGFGGVLGGIASLGMAAATGGGSLGLTGLMGAGGLGALTGGTTAGSVLGPAVSLGGGLGSITPTLPGFSYKGIFG